MSEKQEVGFLPDVIREFPPDLAVTAVFVLVSNFVVFAPVLRETPMRAIISFPLMLFVPGYAFIAAVYPEARTGALSEALGSEVTSKSNLGERLRTLSNLPLGGLERFVLSFGMSVAIVALIGLLLNFTPWGIQLVPIMVGVSGFTLAMIIVAWARRLALPESDRFSVEFRPALTRTVTKLRYPESATEALLNVLLVVAILVAASTIALAVVDPTPGERFTEFYLLSRDDNGDLRADQFPTELRSGRATELVLGIGNQEHRTVEYTVIGRLQRVRTDGNTSTVVESKQLNRFRLMLFHNETAHRTLTVRPTMTGDDLRVVYLLYRGEPPANPNLRNAYRSVYLWVDVTAGDSRAEATNTSTSAVSAESMAGPITNSASRKI